MKKELALTMILAFSIAACKRSKRDPNSDTAKKKTTKLLTLENTKLKKDLAAANKDLSVTKTNLKKVEGTEDKGSNAKALMTQDCQVMALKNSATEVLGENAKNVGAEAANQLASDLYLSGVQTTDQVAKAVNNIVNIADNGKLDEADKVLGTMKDIISKVNKIKPEGADVVAKPDGSDLIKVAAGKVISLVKDQTTADQLVEELIKC
ncbi:hypothetical protein N9N67_08785, partial [Bacteriovoracaceae bacterium]|nr:hypothetical protein [Bacteriovoracaceae bacterium]